MTNPRDYYFIFLLQSFYAILYHEQLLCEQQPIYKAKVYYITLSAP